MKHLPKAAAARPCVRVVLPSGALRATDLPAFEDGISRLNAAGFDVRFDPTRSAARWRDYYAGDDDTRAEELIAALVEPDVDIVWWGRGGSGSARLIPKLLAAAQHMRPRILIGFSDATAVLNALSGRLGWITFHGPAVTSLSRADLDRLRAVVCGEVHSAPILGHDAGAEPSVCLEGRLFGGNLTVLTTLLGTPWQPPVSETIWLLEDVNEASYRIDRALRHLHDATRAQTTSTQTTGAQAAGAWCGPLHVQPEDGSSAHVERIAHDLALPCVAGFPGGHTGEMHLVPIGARVRIDPQAGEMRGTHPWVSARGVQSGSVGAHV